MSGSPTNILDEEHEFYNKNKEKFLHEHTNRYLLIKGSDLIGSFETQGEAVGEGVRLFDAGPFLVRLSGEEDIVSSNPALTLGLLCQS